MKKWASLALVLLVASEVYPKTAAAQGSHPEWLVEQVKNLFEGLGLTVLKREMWLSSLPGIKLPTGQEILEHFGGEAAVRQMLREWGLSENAINSLIAELSTSAPLDRRVDCVIAVRGKPSVFFLVEIKSGDDLRYNVVQTLREALYDAYLAERGDPVVWVTEGEPGSYWARKTLDFLRGRGVGVTTSIANDAMAADALNAVSEKVYKIPLGQIIKDLASRIKQMRLTQFFKEHPEVAATIALVGAEVAVSLWQPSEPWQAELKMRIQDALQAVGMGAAAFTTAEGLMALGLAIAAGSSAGIAAAALALIPVIAPTAYAAATGQQPSPYVKTVKASVGGVELTFALIEPPEPWLPRKLVVSLGGKPLLAAEAQRLTLSMSYASAENEAGGKKLRVWCGGTQCSVTVTWSGSRTEKRDRCAYSVASSCTTTAALTLGDIAAGRALASVTKCVENWYGPLYCETQPARPRETQPAGPAPPLPKQKRIPEPI
jgi:hypothetical protein